MYTYEKFNIQLLPWFALILAILFLFSGMYKEAGISGAIALLFCVSYRGFKIDIQKGLIRQYDRFLWFYIGSWRPIPPPLYVSVVRIRLSSRRVSPMPLPAPETGKSSRTYKLRIVVEGPERYISLTHGNRLEMLEEGLKIARLLHVRLLDQTTSEKRWLA
ncbi:MAG: hypothetical protein WD577_12165 [Bacteroidales bacterium]